MCSLRDALPPNETQQRVSVARPAASTSLPWTSAHRARVAREAEDGHGRAAELTLMVSDEPGRLEAAHDGHLNVHKHQVQVRLRADNVHGLAAVLCRHHLDVRAARRLQLPLEHAPVDVVVVHHCGPGEGAAQKEALKKFFNKAMASSRYVLVMEWNADSVDFKDRKPGELFTKDELIATLDAGNPEQFEYCQGTKDGQRNMLALYRGHFAPTFPHYYTCAVPY